MLRTSHEADGRATKPGVLSGARIADEVVRRVRSRVVDGSDAHIEQLLYETIYREQLRLADNDSDPRVEVDRAFIRTLRHDLAHARSPQLQQLVHSVLTHYTEEISGHFDPRVYKLATTVIPPALGALLHGGRPSLRMFDVRERVLLEGEVSALQWAARAGTVVLVPSHVSNLDSLLLGYAIFALGLPPFAYGAGLNLFSNAIIGYFMRNLGAFTVDRKKQDPLYLDTVKEYATVLLEHGQHMLFFPGGTRSRSGAIESHLKLGFLGAAVSAFGNRRARDAESKPIFFVPCTLTYPLVLEGASLIDEFLRREGGPHFVDVRDEFERPERWYDFLRQLAELDLQVHVRFGTPLDIVGNKVDVRASGISRDRRGRPVDPVRYLYRDGAVVHDPDRDAQYTRLLADEIAQGFRGESVALPSSVLAYAVFRRLRARYPTLDVLRLLRVLGPHASITLSELRPELDILLAKVSQLSAASAIHLSPELQGAGVQDVLESGAKTLSSYHREPVVVLEGDLLRIHDPNLLLYYRNRLAGYGLCAEQDDPAEELRASRRFRP